MKEHTQTEEQDTDRELLREYIFVNQGSRVVANLRDRGLYQVAKDIWLCTFDKGGSWPS